jgi:hypothetical protein
VSQNVLTADLVVQSIETITRFCLRFRVQRLLQFLNTGRSLLGCPISRSLTAYCVRLELRSRPSAGITRPQRYNGPLRLPKAPSLSLTGVQLVIPDHALGSPVLRSLSLCTCCRHYPGAAAGRILRSFSQPYQPSPKGSSGRPTHLTFRGLLGVHSRYGLHTRAVTVDRDTLTEGFSHFVTSMTAPVASGWSDCRVGLTPTGKRRLPRRTPTASFRDRRLMHCERLIRSPRRRWRAALAAWLCRASSRSVD